ncbi:hypothetical protein RHIZ404_220161 [Rhizobium sp. EC-SD404]|nr:hypothetical protein RHIZ404_220161 [Rhizobium sp. EC-SD404]
MIADRHLQHGAELHDLNLVVVAQQDIVPRLSQAMKQIAGSKETTKVLGDVWRLAQPAGLV